MFNFARFGCLLLASLLCTAAVPAQQSSPQAQAGGGKMHLDVVVAPKSGPSVGDLQQQDFTLLDNKVPQTITSFKAVNGREAPIEVILVMDFVNISTQNVISEREQIDKFLRAEGGHLAYPIALAAFTDQGTQIVENFSSDGNALSAALQQDEISRRVILSRAGLYGADDRWRLSMKALYQLVASVAPHQGRKVILWVSPGWPLLTGPSVTSDAKEARQIFSEIVSFSTELRQARVTLYSVDPLGAGESITRTSYNKDLLKAVTKPNQASLGNLGLPMLAIQSGGLALSSSNDTVGLLQQCMADATPYYEISFDPPAARQRDEYHGLEVQVAKPGLTARTRQGYYAEP